MESLTIARPSEGDIQIHMKWEQQDSRNWDFLLRYSEGVLKDVAGQMVVRSDRVECPAGDCLLAMWETCKYSRRETRSARLSTACLQQARVELDKGNYIEAIRMSVYSDVYSFDSNLEWFWHVAPLSYMTVSTNMITESQDYVEQLCEASNG